VTDTALVSVRRRNVSVIQKRHSRERERERGELRGVMRLQRLYGDTAAMTTQAETSADYRVGYDDVYDEYPTMLQMLPLHATIRA